jgi:RNA polymerase sigma factor (sigma-70 family)
MLRSRWESWDKAVGAAKRKILADIMRAEDKLIRSCAQKVTHRSAYYTDELKDDMLQAAKIGFIRAMSKWDPKRGAFSTVAWWWMRHEMQGVLRCATPITRPKSADLPRATQDVAAAHYAKYGREATYEELGITASAAQRASNASATFVPVTRVTGLGLRADSVVDNESSMGAVLRPTDKLSRDVATDNLQAAEIPDAEGDIDRKREVAALRGYLAKLSTKARKEFWSGKNPALIARAKAAVQAARGPKGRAGGPAS